MERIFICAFIVGDLYRISR